MVQIGHDLKVTYKAKDLDLSYACRQNSKGIIYRISAVLYVHGFSIQNALVTTTGDNEVVDKFTAFLYADVAPDIEQLKLDLDNLLSDKVTVMTYISQFPEKYHRIFQDRSQTTFRELTVVPGETSRQAEIKLITLDRPGLIFEITQLLYMMYYDIKTIKAETNENSVTDHLVIQREDHGIIEPDNLEALQRGIEKLL